MTINGLFRAPCGVECGPALFLRGGDFSAGGGAHVPGAPFAGFGTGGAFGLGPAQLLGGADPGNAGGADFSPGAPGRGSSGGGIALQMV